MEFGSQNMAKHVWIAAANADHVLHVRIVFKTVTKQVLTAEEPIVDLVLRCARMVY
jgi:hypothetical protein